MRFFGPTARRLLARLPLAAGAALFLWFIGLDHVWGHLVTDSTEGLIRLFERPRSTFLEWDSGAIVISRSDFSSRSDLPSFGAASLTGNLVLFLALVWATPGSGTRRGFVGLLGGTVALYLSHVIHAALTVETVYATSLGAWSVAVYPRWQRELLASGRYFFDIALKYALPFLLWAFFVGLPLLRATEGAPGPVVSRRRRKRK